MSSTQSSSAPGADRGPKEGEAADRTLETVLGPIPAAEMGDTMSHVHLTLDISCWHMPPEDPALAAESTEEMTLERIGRVRRNGLAYTRNLRQDDTALTIREVTEYKQAGGRTLINMDLEGIGRDVGILQEISRATGLHIVASTGWYIQGTHPEFVASKDISELADIMTRELQEGIGNTGVRAGNIGEIGLSGMPDQPWQPDEEKVLRAAARAQARTGASLTIHPNAHLRVRGEIPVDHFEVYLDALESEGADLSRVYPSHLGLFDADIAERLLKRGVGFVSFDHFGHEELAEGIGPGRGFTPDRLEVDMVMELLERGYADRILIGAEVGWKTCYKAFGGWGYSHIHENILPWLASLGATDEQLRQIMVENPQKLHASGA